MDADIEQLLREYDARSAEEWRRVEALGPSAFANRDEMAGPFDFVLVDLWKELYVPCFGRRVRDSGRFDTVLLPVGSGLELSRLRS